MINPDLKDLLRRNRSEVRARGHDWDVADVVHVIETYLATKGMKDVADHQ